LLASRRFSKVYLSFCLMIWNYFTWES
jgi:hypothetical protein